MVVQGFARTSVSLLQLVVWVVPMLALVTGAVVGSECHELELVAALPVSRCTVVVTRWLAWSASLGAALLVGLGAAGVAIAWLAGSANLWRYLRLIGVAELVLVATLALGLWIGVAARTRLKAVGVAVGVWFVLVIGVDLLAIGALAILPAGRAGWWLSLLLMADPVDSARALGLSPFPDRRRGGPHRRGVAAGARRDGGLGPRGSAYRVDAGAAGVRRANLHTE